MLPAEIAAQLPPSVLTKSQKRKYGPRLIKEGGKEFTISATVRFDDECGNGHNTFSITGEIPAQGMFGCLHDEIAKHFPELAPLIKWHLVSTDGPMHYVANVTYHASDCDHNGLRKGETRQIRNGRTGKLCWKLKDVPLPEYVDSDEKPLAKFMVEYEPWNRIGEGKARDFDAARRIAVWPDATDEQLSLPKPELTALLLARLPALMVEFKAAVESLGFTY